MVVQYSRDQLQNLQNQKRLSGKQTEQQRLITRGSISKALAMYPDRRMFSFVRTDIGLILLEEGQDVGNIDREGIKEVDMMPFKIVTYEFLIHASLEGVRWNFDKCDESGHEIIMKDGTMVCHNCLVVRKAENR